mmetsp:Transcript_22385/g.66366  ORF Transcript_22385/g.66366 Transcript_22385/m.66366 type:complete len:107 (-) Transcript_22385:314-634(-)
MMTTRSWRTPLSPTAAPALKWFLRTRTTADAYSSRSSIMLATLMICSDRRRSHLASRRRHRTSVTCQVKDGTRGVATKTFEDEKRGREGKEIPAGMNVSAMSYQLN